ncbi:MAG: cytochrome c-type biogenesis protein CcmI, partial [Candidatus Azotimanducaceae bacterium]
MFWLVVSVLGLVASLFVVMPYFLRSNRVIDDRNELNVDLYRDRVSDIHDSDADNPDTLELEAKMALLEDTVLEDRISEVHLSQNKGLEPETDVGEVSYKEGSFKLMLGFAIAIPFFALFVYHEAGLNQGAIPDVLIAESLERLSPEDQEGYLKATELIADRLESKPDDADLKFLLASA